MLVRQLRAAGGIQISASHNPPQYNGLKLFSAEGRVDSRSGRRRSDRALSAAAPAWRRRTIASAACTHATTRSASIWSLVLQTVDVERHSRRAIQSAARRQSRRGQRARAADCSTSWAASVTVLGETPDGQFEHAPEPTAENLAGVLAAVPRHGCDVGFCQDPDADRLAVIDEAGRYLGEEYTLAMCVAAPTAQRSAGRS